MAKIGLEMHKERLERAVGRMRKQKIVLPTFAQMKNPDLIPDKVQKRVELLLVFGMSTRAISSEFRGKTNQLKKAVDLEV